MIRRKTSAYITCRGAGLGIGEHGSPAVQSQDSFPIGYRGHLTVMLRDGGHLLGHIAVDVLKAVPGREGAPDFVGPDATAESDAGFKHAFPRQFAGKTMGRMSVKLLIQRIDFGWPQASEYLDESSV